MIRTGPTELAIREAEFRHETLRANGLSFHAVTQGEGPSVLLLHGFPESWYSWRYQIHALAAAGFRAVAVDLRGYGETDRPRGVRAYSLTRLCADVEGLIAALGDHPLHLVGHDWGGVIAWFFAARRPGRLASLSILNAPHPRLFARHLMTNPRQMRRSWYVVFYQLPWLPERMFLADPVRAFRALFRGWAIRREMFPEEVIDRFREPMLEPGALSAAIHYYRALVRDPRNWAAAWRFPRLAIPTCVIWAQEDRALGPELCDGLEREFVGPFELHRIARCSHWVQQEQPEAVNEILVGFLNRARQGT